MFDWLYGPKFEPQVLENFERIFEPKNVNHPSYLHFVNGSIITSIQTEEYGRIKVEKDLGFRQNSTVYTVSRGSDLLFYIDTEGRGKIENQPLEIGGDKKPSMEEVTAFIAEITERILGDLPPDLENMYFHRII